MPAQKKYQNEIVEKLANFNEVEMKGILDFINFLEKEKKKKVYQRIFKDLQSDFQKKLVLKEALKEIEDYRSGR
jgi:hypothetical protein